MVGIVRRALLRATVAVCFVLIGCGGLGFEVPGSAFCYHVESDVYDAWPTFDDELEQAADNWGAGVNVSALCPYNRIALVEFSSDALARHRGETMPYGYPVTSVIEINASAVGDLMLAGVECAEGEERWPIVSLLTFHLGQAFGFVPGETDGIMASRELQPCVLEYPSEAELALLRSGQ